MNRFLSRLLLVTVAAVCMITLAKAQDALPLFVPPVSSENPAPKLDLFEHPATVSAEPAPLDLFDCGPARTIAQTVPTADASKPEPPAAKPDTRPVVVAWSPIWCSACNIMCSLVGTGNPNVRVRWIKGDDEDFPPEVRAYAATHGYPVLQYQPVDGKGAWRFAPHARTIEDLQALVKLKSSDAIPDSHFREAMSRVIEINSQRLTTR